MTMRKIVRLWPVFGVFSWGLLGCSASDNSGGSGRSGSAGTSAGSGGSGATGGTDDSGTTGGSGGTGGSTGGTGGSTGGSGGTGGTAGTGGTGTSDAGGGTQTCLQVQQCQNQCGGSSSCEAACLAMGTPEAQMLTTQLADCVSTNCPAGSPQNCSTTVQCAADGACRMLDETCVGQSPDPDCP